MQLRHLASALLISALTSGAASTLAEGNLPGMSPTPEDADNVVRKPSYSPYAGRNFPTNVYWGDTHVHTDNSLDAKGFGANLGVETAFRFARGEEVKSNTGIPFKLSRPLDWVVVADHSNGMGAMKEIFKGNPNLISDPTVRDWYERMNTGGSQAFAATMDVINAFSQGAVPAVVLDRTFQRSIWEDYIETAEQYNEPGRFTAMLGYEWTSTEKGNNLHRNVLNRDGGDVAARMVPYTTAESFNPEDLWKWMEACEQKTGGQVLALAHSGNMSNGIMFPLERNPANGKRLGAGYMKSRIRWEPLYEVTQIKGDGEAHPFLSPDDEFADFETLEIGNLNLTVVKEDDMLQYEYARQALKNGLKLEAKFAGRQYDGYAMSASGYAAVWATENTREALWDAMMRKEVYNVAWADAERRSLDANGDLPAVGNTVDMANATWTNTIGDPELITVWTDPDFDADQRAFYYARVMEIPTPRWTAYDAKRCGLKLPDNVPVYLLERAYTSPIWYTPWRELPARQHPGPRITFAALFAFYPEEL